MSDRSLHLSSWQRHSAPYAAEAAAIAMLIAAAVVCIAVGHVA